ncbi:hypothetical protein LCGC14_0691530, partial [marine sediment metagenome]
MAMKRVPIRKPKRAKGQKQTLAERLRKAASP